MQKSFFKKNLLRRCQSYTKVALIFQHPFLIGLQKSDKFSGDHLKKPALSSIWPYTYIVKKTRE